MASVAETAVYQPCIKVPCPFCGGTANDIECDEATIMQCNDCTRIWELGEERAEMAHIIAEHQPPAMRRMTLGEAELIVAAFAGEPDEEPERWDGMS